ncbi:MAG: DUF131 domain-containing protein [Candidatus Bathyarchaeota archaeon]|nr:MAG: DUF131 domain-containing protein [Candidatus Bathyarchaeota archaeon]
MDVSTLLLGLGLVMTVLGALMVVLSMKSRGNEREHESSSIGVIFLGPIPTVLGGRGRWILIGVATAILLIFLFTINAYQPDLLRW